MRLGKIWDDQCKSLYPTACDRRFAGGIPAAASPGTFEQKLRSFFDVFCFLLVGKANREWTKLVKMLCE